ncbi:protein BCCIP homolog isoform X2 [Aristolochia californica]|uniref:protein BCCIP homolog isoform X2 n=1 Tax=Aristolochia californica TaxID=171875 RepID=UPI0035D65632
MLPGRRLLGFSSFARSLARVQSARKLKRPRPSPISKSRPKTLSTSSGKVDHSLKKRSRHPESSEEVDEGFVQVDFAFFDPKPEDFHGVKILLQTYLDNQEWDLNGFVDLILGQKRVGTVVKVEEDEDDSPFSVLSAINLGYHKDHKCIKELKEYILKGCHKLDIKDNLKLFLGEQAQNVGLLVSQRVLNLPPQLLPPLYDAIFDEILWATEDEPTEELQESYRFKFYLLVSRIYKNKNTKVQKEACSEPIIYIKPEDEIFQKLSSWSFTFSLCTQQLAPRELRNYEQMGLVMLVKEDRIPTFREELKSLVQES